MTDPTTPTSAAPVRTKPCNGCGKLVPITERKYETGLCINCQKVAEEYFGIAPEQAGLAIMAKINVVHYSTGLQGWAGLSLRDKVRRIILAAAKSLHLATLAEIEDAACLRERYPFMERAQYLSAKNQIDFLEGMP